MFPGTVAALGISGLKDCAGHPTMPLVIHGVSSFQEREPAILRFQSGLQVRAIIDRMGPGVAGEQFKTVREVFLYAYRQRVIPGAGVGKLRVDAVEWNRDAEPLRVMCGVRQE